jgi:glycosyltransferase involved in cell wall biosynthesis
MRVLVLTSSYPKFPGDGTAPFVERMAVETARRGHAVEVVLPEHPDLVTEDRSAGLALRLHPHRSSWPGMAPRWGYAASMAADRRLRVSAWSAAPIALASAIRRAGRLLQAERFDLVHAHWVIPNGPVGAWAAARARVPLVVSLHGSDVFVAEAHPLLRAVARRVLERSAWVIASSRDLAERAVALAPSCRPEVLLYGVDPADVAFGDPEPWRRAAGREPGEMLVVALGRLVAKKGFSTLVDAIALLRRRGVSVRLLLGGDGDLAADLEIRARSAGAEGFVRQAGRIPHDRVGGFLRAGDVVVVPSVRDERGNVDGLPNVLLEALAAGRPVVASRIGGIPEVVVDGDNGLLVPPGDAGALADALQRLAEDPGLRMRLAAGAVSSASRHTWSAYGQRLVSGYERLAGGAR